MIDERKLTKYMRITFCQLSKTIPTKVVVLDASVPGPKCKNWLVKPPSFPMKVIYPVKYIAENIKIVFGDDKKSAKPFDPLGPSVSLCPSCKRGSFCSSSRGAILMLVSIWTFVTCKVTFNFLQCKGINKNSYSTLRCQHIQQQMSLP